MLRALRVLYRARKPCREYALAGNALASMVPCWRGANERKQMIIVLCTIHSENGRWGYQYDPFNTSSDLIAPSSLLARSVTGRSVSIM